MKSLSKTLAAAAVATGMMAGSAMAAELPVNQFKVVGTWGFLEHYKNNENPFWQEVVPKASGGRITAQSPSYTELGLSGYEPMRLLKLGVFDFVHGVTSYFSSDSAVIEGVDLAGIAQSVENLSKVTDVYQPILEKEFEKKFKAQLLMLYSFPSQMLFCNLPSLNSVADLKGKKIRTYSTTLGDFIEGMGASAVTIAFAEVVPALQKGVAHCGITGTMPAYNAKWWQVVTHVLKLRVGWGVSFLAANKKRWDGLDGATKDFMTTEIAALKVRMWDSNSKADARGVACNTSGPCDVGKPGGMKPIEPSAADEKERERILSEVVLKRWAKRCGQTCVDEWNGTVGRVLNMKASM